jgi:branched-chain amino acid transport system substrate-binding protein
VNIKRLSPVVLAATCVVALGACGSSSGGGGSSSTATSSSAAAAATVASSTAKGAPIVVGSVCSCSGLHASATARVKDVSVAWADAVNARGGINGHPVKMIVKDDGSDPAQALKIVKDLVQNQHVMAIVGDDSLVDQAWAPYVASTGVPVVGGFSFEAPFVTNPSFFASGTQVPVATLGTMTLAKQAGKKKMGILYCAETPACAQFDPIGKGSAKLVGLGYTSGKVSATAPSYTAPCLAMKSAGADALFVVHNGAVVQRIVDGCAEQGYRPLQVAQMNAVEPGWLKDPNFEGAVLSSPTALYSDAAQAAVKEMLDALDKYAPGLRDSAGFNPNVIYPWTAGKLFEAAATSAAIKPTSTPADVKKGLYGLKNETLGGLTPPLNFTAGQPAFVPCYFTVGLQGGKFVPRNGDKPTCPPAAQLTALATALKGG